jgi:hypothetical protein
VAYVTEIYFHTVLEAQVKGQVQGQGVARLGFFSGRPLSLVADGHFLTVSLDALFSV